jgi:hypothetical protein
VNSRVRGRPTCLRERAAVNDWATRALAFPFQPTWHCSAPNRNFDLTGGDPRRTTALPITTAKYFPSKTPGIRISTPGKWVGIPMSSRVPISWWDL